MWEKFVNWLSRLFSGAPVVAAPSDPNRRTVSNFLRFLETFLGVPYKWGGDYDRWLAKKDFGLDCSGFEQAAARWQGIDQPGDQTAEGIKQWYLKKGKVVPASEAQAGDRCFYGGSGKITDRATHITIAVGIGKEIEAGGGGSKTTTEAIARAQGAQVRYNKIGHRNDLQCVIRPDFTFEPEEAPAIENFNVPGFRPEWTSAGLSLIKSELLDSFDQGAKDMERFFPGYGKLNPDQRAKVWLTLFGAICSFESGPSNPKSGEFFRTNVVYKESDGSDSEGLFQLTYGNKFCPKTKAEGNLHDPILNLLAALRLGASFVAADDVVAFGGYTKYGAPPARGLAKYWSAIRVPDNKSKHHLAEIISKTKKAKV